MNTITFDASVKSEILALFDKEIDQQGFIVEKGNPSQRVHTPDGDEILSSDFAGIFKGSEILVKSDIVSLLELADHLK